jgi:hypothetical protein
MRKSILSLLVFSLLLAVAILFVTSFDIAITSSAQNANSSTTTNKNQNENRSISAGAGAPQQDFSKNTWELPDDADKTKNPTPATPESIAKGKELIPRADQGQLHFLSRRDRSGQRSQPGETAPQTRRPNKQRTHDGDD